MKSQGQLIHNKYKILNTFPFVIGVLYYTEVQSKEEEKPTCFLHGLDLKRLGFSVQQGQWIETLYDRNESIFIPLEEVFIEEDTLYQVYKRLEGYLLAHYIKNHFPIHITKCLTMVQQVIDHLLYLYQKKQFAIIHPQNMIISRDEKFRFLYGGPTEHLPRGMVYTHQSEEANRQVDSYSLGALIYQMLTGKSPMSNGLKIPPLRQVVSDCPSELDQMVMRALSFDAEKRPSIEEFKTIVEQLVSS